MIKVLKECGVPVKCWIGDLPFEEQAQQQLLNITTLPFIFKHVAAMPDVHFGLGATVGSVIATQGAVVPSFTGVDIGCGVQAFKTPLTASDLPADLLSLRTAIEAVVPHGGPGAVGSWPEDGMPELVKREMYRLGFGYDGIVAKNPELESRFVERQMGTLGTGNHFLEICLDPQNQVWVLLHSGSRGVGNQIGRHFIREAKYLMEKFYIDLRDRDLAYLPEDSDTCREYLEAVNWAQDYARSNRTIMMVHALQALSEALGGFKAPTDPSEIVNKPAFIDCHHNFIDIENHFGENVFVTRKGAVRARPGELVIIPGSMGAKTYIAGGLGNRESFMSCSHGAGRAMSRTVAKKTFSLEDHAAATSGIECRKDKDVLDETPGAYKNIDAVMEAQKDLVKVITTLKQVLCIKG
jgi:tRNA-splicing ligase RtcB